VSEASRVARGVLPGFVPGGERCVDGGSSAGSFLASGPWWVGLRVVFVVFEIWIVDASICLALERGPPAFVGWVGVLGGVGRCDFVCKCVFVVLVEYL
jgi:hypothetical protein